MQTILGSGGIISSELAKSLRKYDDSVRLVSRNPTMVDGASELVTADLTVPAETMEAVKGSSVAYLTIGLPYKAKTWQEMWPLVMKNVISACKAHNTKLVFFDNIYMYDPAYFENITEDTPFNPPSKKGKVRQEIARMLLSEIENETLTGLIARCADYYGPGIDRNSMLNEMVVKNLVNGKKANWLSSLNFKHSFTYTVDAGEATALLGNTPDAFNQTWHLPTAENPPTGKEWIEQIAAYLKVAPKSMVVSPFMASLLGLFIPVMREVKEMMYQYDRDYIFNSDKFNKQFNYTPTPYKEGIKKMLSADYSSRVK